MPNSYRFDLAKTETEISAYFALRQMIFVQEQNLFDTQDIDELDTIAHPIIARPHSPLPTSPLLIPHSPIIGVVRILESAPRLWYGGRLGVHPDYRRVGKIGQGLIQKAVTTANGWGCDRFLATVQLQNVRFFRRLHWQSLEEIQICGLPHHLMEADLNHYPPSSEPRPSPSRLAYPLPVSA